MFKPGDRVRIVMENSGNHRDMIGKTVVISSVDRDGYLIRGVPPSWGHWGDNEFELIKGGAMSKYYRVIKDTPAWTEGAIVELDDECHYRAISDLWNAFDKDYPDNYFESASIIENSPEWFERVYSTKVLGQTKYVVKDIARKLHADEYKKSR